MLLLVHIIHRCPSTFGNLYYAIVNELSGTIQLEETLLRAEALFRRFQRLVETIDKRKNFPAPAVRQRKPIADGSSSADKSSSSPDGAEVGASSSTDAAKQPGQEEREQGQGQGQEQEEEGAQRPGSSKRKGKSVQEAKKVQKEISPELRKLLSRAVEKVGERDNSK